VVAEVAISRKGLVEEDQIEIIPERVTASCLDENVCLSSCGKYLTTDAWLALEGVVAAIANNPCYNYFCGRCINPIDDTENSILCDSCLIRGIRHFKKLCMRFQNQLISMKSL